MNINYITHDPELQAYIPSLNRFMKIELKQELTGNEELLDALLAIIIGTRNIRQGKAPSIEAQANIVGLMRQCIEKNAPIPVLVGAGPKKTSDDASIDIAELSVLSILDCVNQNIKRIYAPGLEIKIRLENLTGLYIEGKESKPSMQRYMDDFDRLVSILGYEGISTFTEDELTSEYKFINTADEVYPIFLRYLEETDLWEEADYRKSEAFQELQEYGWAGTVPSEMRNYLYSKYDRLYPNQSRKFQIKVAARYLSATLARNLTDSTGHKPELYSFHLHPMEIAFAHPTPGIPEGMHSKRVYYRTVPLTHTKRDMPFWRARGILKVNKMGEVRYSLIGWSMEENSQVIPGHYMISNETDSVILNAGTIIED